MLEGTLESFTLPDIFQLLAFTKKDGCLVLRQTEQTGRVYFKDGQVYYALSSHGHLALGRRLVGAGLVQREGLDGALAKQTEARREGRGLRLGQILVQESVLDAETLDTFVREQIQDAVFDLMRWTTGAFTFQAADDGGTIDEAIELSVSVENLIMEGSRRIEEWDQVNKKIPSMSAVVAMAPLPGDSGVEVSLKPDEWRLLTLVDGRRTVNGLIDLFGQGEFATCKILYGMVGAGLLEVRDPELEGPLSIASLLEQQELLAALEHDGPMPTKPVEVDVELEVTPEPGSEPDSEPSNDDAAPAETPEPEKPRKKSKPKADPAAAKVDADVPEAKPSAPQSPSAQRGLKAKVHESSGEDAGLPDGKRLTTDPSIDADLVKRLIDGVKGL